MLRAVNSMVDWPAVCGLIDAEPPVRSTGRLGETVQSILKWCRGLERTGDEPEEALRGWGGLVLRTNLQGQ